MLKTIFKTKSVIAILLVLALLFLTIPAGNYKSAVISVNTHTSQRSMIFSPMDFTATFFFSEKANQFRESHFAEAKSRRQLVSFENRIISLQTTICKDPFIDYGITVFPFYVIICILIVQTIIKYIYNTDGKKRTSYFYIK